MKKRIGVKWYRKDADLYLSLTDEQLGELVRAVMNYAATGEKVPISDEIIWPFGEQCRKIDAEKARTKGRQEARRQDEF